MLMQKKVIMDYQNGLLFSNKNFELSFNLGRITQSTKTFVTYAKDYDEFFSKLMSFNPDFVIIDLDTISLPVGILKTFVNKKIFHIQEVFFFSVKRHSGIKGGIDIDYSNLKEILSVCCNHHDGTKTIELKRNEQLSSKITKMLIDYGFSTKHLGFAYIKDILIDILGDNSALKSFNGNVYPKLACRYCATVASVERNIRNAITYVYRSRKEEIDEIFHKNTSPSIREVMFYLVDILMVEVA